MMTNTDLSSNNILAALKAMREYLHAQDARINELVAQFHKQSTASITEQQLQTLQAQIEEITKTQSITAQRFYNVDSSLDTLKKQLDTQKQRVEELHFLSQQNEFNDKNQQLIKENQAHILSLEQQLQVQHNKLQDFIEQTNSKLLALQQAVDEYALDNSKLDDTKWVSLEHSEPTIFTFVENQLAKKNIEANQTTLKQDQQPQEIIKKTPAKSSIWEKIKHYRPFKRTKKNEKQSQDYLKTSSMFVEEQMIGLYRSLTSLLPNKRHWGRSIQFIASRSQEGTSIICREFAKVLARRLDMSVLLIDADPQGKQLAHFGIERSAGWSEAVFNNVPIQYALKQIAASKLFVTQMAIPGESVTKIVHAPEIEAILEELKRQFDYIVIDSLPGTVSVDGLTLSHKVDGVILVVEAESTRWQIVQQTKENIEIRGGNVLGVILNKRRFYIPKFIYDRLL